MNASGKDPHLDPLALDALRTGDGSAEERSHLERCDSCREALLELERLALTLRSRAEAGEVPLEVDQAVLSFARGELMLPRRRKAVWLRGLAAAAAILIAAAGIWLAFLGPSIPGGRREGVDIVDAYVLALRIRSGDTAAGAWDRNQDGVVDARDVEELARASVSLARGGK